MNLRYFVSGRFNSSPGKTLVRLAPTRVRRIHHCSYSRGGCCCLSVISVEDYSKRRDQKAVGGIGIEFVPHYSWLLLGP